MELIRAIRNQVLPVLFVALAGTNAWAQVIPPFLPSGSQFRYAFVTSQTRSITTGDIADYNTFVTTLAESQPDLLALGTSWNVLGSSWTVDARDNTGTNPTNAGHVSVPIYLLNGTRIADGNADLWDGSLAAPINITESGSAATGGTAVATGTTANGQAAAAPFGSAINFLFFSIPVVTVGRLNRTDDAWTSDGNQLFPNLPVYALSAPITVGGDSGGGGPSVPEPGVATLLTIVLVPLGIDAVRRGRAGRGKVPQAKDSSTN